MKKILMIILCAAIISPAFALAEDKSEKSKGNDIRKSEQMIEKIEKKDNKKEDYKENKEKDNKDTMNVQKEMKRVVARLEAAIARVQRLSDRVAERLTKFEARGVNTAASRAHLLEAKVKLDEARAKVVAIKLSIETANTTATTTAVTTTTATTTASTTASTTEKNKMKAIKIAVKSAKDTIKEAHSHVALAISASKPGQNDGNNATTTPDIVAPTLSAIVASGITPTSATITWTTSEAANGNVYFSTSTPVSLTTASTLGNASSSISHSFVLNALTPSTTYFYLVRSADVANNTATSSSFSFVTPATPDIAAPVISAVAVFAVASTTATVTWNTNELATGKLFYGTSTPLTTFVYNGTPSLAHTLSLTGLTASTTYSLLLESKDAQGNTATTTSSLVTTI